MEAKAAAAKSVVGRAQIGDRDAFADLVARYGEEMLRLCAVITGDPTLAQDASQSAWQHAWQGLRRLRDETKVKGWLMRLAANEARQIVRRQRRESGRTMTLPSELSLQASYNNDELQEFLLRLPAQDRELLAYRYLFGFNSEEIASALRLSAGGVRSRLKRIRDRAREDLKDD